MFQITNDTMPNRITGDVIMSQAFSYSPLLKRLSGTQYNNCNLYFLVHPFTYRTCYIFLVTNIIWL